MFWKPQFEKFWKSQQSPPPTFCIRIPKPIEINEVTCPHHPPRARSWESVAAIGCSQGHCRMMPLSPLFLELSQQTPQPRKNWTWKSGWSHHPIVCSVTSKLVWSPARGVSIDTTKMATLPLPAGEWGWLWEEASGWFEMCCLPHCQCTTFHDLKKRCDWRGPHWTWVGALRAEITLQTAGTPS